MTTPTAAPAAATPRMPLPRAAGLVPLSRVSLFDGLPAARIAWLEARLPLVR